VVSETRTEQFAENSNSIGLREEHKFLEVAEKVGFAFCLWVAQRFTAAVAACLQ
jgi:hypothetical protein